MREVLILLVRQRWPRLVRLVLTGQSRLPQAADPWDVARSRYLQSLDPEERILFTEATIQNLYYSASNTVRDDRLNSKTRRAISAAQPLVDKIEEYGKAMDTYANMAPNFLAPVWGSLRVVLVLAKSLGKFFDRMTDTLGRIGDILPRLLVSIMSRSFLEIANHMQGLSTRLSACEAPTT